MVSRHSLNSDQGLRSTLLLAAQAGDGDAFAEWVGPFLGELQANCYRMLGSVQDAEDALQETLARAWRSLDRFDERGTTRAWLYAIATNRCLTLLAQRDRRVLPTDAGVALASAEYAWVEPYPGGHLAWSEALDPAERTVVLESVELAFVVALQHLPARQRAVLLLREVLGFSAREVANLLHTSVPAVNSALQRGRSTLAQLSPDVTQQAALAAVGPTGLGQVAKRYAAAWEAGDVDTVVAMLTDDARYSMPPLVQWYRGRASVTAFLADVMLTSRWRFLPARANGQLAFGTYRWDDAQAAYLPAGLDLLTLQGTQVREVVSFLRADLTTFALPAQLT